MKIFRPYTTILLAVSVAANVLVIANNISLRQQISTQQSILNGLETTLADQSESIREIAKQRTLALQIQPSIENRVTSAFGSTKNVTLQYYFTIDGNSIITQPDSIYKHTFDKIR